MNRVELRRLVSWKPTVNTQFVYETMQKICPVGNQFIETLLYYQAIPLPAFQYLAQFQFLEHCSSFTILFDSSFLLQLPHRYRKTALLVCAQLICQCFQKDFLYIKEIQYFHVEIIQNTDKQRQRAVMKSKPANLGENNQTKPAYRDKISHEKCIRL